MYLALVLQIWYVPVARTSVLVLCLRLSNVILPSGFATKNYTCTPLRLSRVSSPDDFIIFAWNPKLRIQTLKFPILYILPRARSKKKSVNICLQSSEMWHLVVWQKIPFRRYSGIHLQTTESKVSFNYRAIAQAMSRRILAAEVRNRSQNGSYANRGTKMAIRKGSLQILRLLPSHSLKKTFWNHSSIGHHR
jgi:hypothetical protein